MYPVGFFPSRSPEQTEFDAAREEYREPLSQIDHNMTQERLEEVCVDVLLQLFKEVCSRTSEPATRGCPKTSQRIGMKRGGFGLVNR
jgi:hypothetical protein